MDSYSGSEPRLFISFRLGNESNGQPRRRGADDEKMDSNDSFVTAIATTENQPTVDASIRVPGVGDSGSTVRVEAVVRGRDGKLLTPYELEQELKYFIDEPLVDIGEKLPFYEDYIRGTDYMASSSDNRARIQISVLGNYLRSFGDINTLRSFWRDVGVIVNHQSLFTDIDWSKERLSVSNLFWSH